MDFDLNDIWRKSDPAGIFENMETPFNSNELKEVLTKQLHDETQETLQKDYPLMLDTLHLIRNIIIKSEITPKALKIMVGNEEEKEDHLYQINRLVELAGNLTNLISKLYDEKITYEKENEKY